MFTMNSAQTYNVAMTGTQHGVSDEQLRTFRRFLMSYMYAFKTFHMGDCIGADAQITTVVQMKLAQFYMRLMMQYIHRHSTDTLPLDVILNRAGHGDTQGVVFNAFHSSKSLSENTLLSAAMRPTTQMFAHYVSYARANLLKQLLAFEIRGFTTTFFEWYQNASLPKIVVHPPVNNSKRAFWKSVLEKPDYHTIIEQLESLVQKTEIDTKHWMTALRHEWPIESREPADYLERNRAMVDTCDFVCAFPKENAYPGQTRSGTWYTIRYALRQKRPVFVFFHDGTMKTFLSYEYFTSIYPRAPKS